MSELLRGQNISSAWLSAMEYLLQHGQVAVNLCVQITEPVKEDAGIRRAIDTYLRLRRFQAVQTVANTIFPQAFYRPHLGEGARQHLYEMQDEVKDVVRRHPGNRYGTYIARLTNWPGTEAGINQLEETVLKIKREIARPNPLSSIYELSLSSLQRTKNIDLINGVAIEREKSDTAHKHNGSDDGPEPLEMHIYAPGKDKQIMAFPCLSHISLTLVKRRLHMTAVYRNQYFVQKAYGNYLGLSRLLQFLCLESDCEPGEILCIATHAKAERSKGELQSLVEECYRSAEYDSGIQATGGEPNRPLATDLYLDNSR